MQLKSLHDWDKTASIILYGNTELIAEGCKSIADYSDTVLELDMGKYNLKIRGASLVIKTYLYEQVAVTGQIISVEYSGGGEVNAG